MTAGTWMDYSETYYRVYFETGGGAEYSEQVAIKFIKNYLAPFYQENLNTPKMEFITIKAVPSGIEGIMPMQMIPDIVIALAEAKVAIYQILRIEAVPESYFS